MSEFMKRTDYNQHHTDKFLNQRRVKYHFKWIRVKELIGIIDGFHLQRFMCLLILPL